MNEVYDYGQNSCYDSTSIGFDQSQPQQYTINHPIFNTHKSCLDSRIQLNSTLANIQDQMTSITSLCELACQFVQKKLEEKQLEEEQTAKAQYWKPPVCCDDDDDEESSKECLSSGALYTKSCACSKGGFIDNFVRDLNKTLDSSQRPRYECLRCGSPVDGLYCRHCALLWKKLKEAWFTICDEHKFSKEFLNTFESSNDDSNVVNMPQEPIVFNQDPSENSSQSPPKIDHRSCYGCGDSLDGIFCQQCTCKSCGKGAHYGYNCPPKVLIISNPEPCHNQNIEELPQTLPSFHPTCYSGEENSFTCDSTPNLVNDSPNQRINDSMIELREMFQAWLQQRKDQVCQKIPLCYDDDDDEESSTPSRDIIISELPPCIESTPVLSTKETKDSLIMGSEHLDTIPEKELDEFIKSSVKNLIPNPSESDNEREYDVLVCDDFTTFSNLIFDADVDFSSSDNELFSDEDIPKEFYSNPFFDEEIIFIMIDPRHFNAESDLIESLINQDSSIISSSKVDSLLDEFAGELILLKSILPGIDEADYDPEEEIRLIEKLLYDNSSSRPPKEIDFENSDDAIESFTPSPVLVEDSDSLMEEIDLSLTPDDSMPPGIENDDYDSEGDILILKELLRNNFLSLLKNKSFHFDIPSSPRPSTKPSDDDDIEPNSRILTVKVVGDIFEHYALMPRLLPTQPTLASNQEKSHHLLSHRGLKAFQLSSESPIMIYRGNIPILDVLFLHFYPP
nr:hypothetical protein [Tanacetum cinerariifolium]